MVWNCGIPRNLEHTIHFMGVLCGVAVQLGHIGGARLGLGETARIVA
jgi:hypothetical protein